MTQRPDFITFPGKIHLITDASGVQAAAANLLSSSELGFDTETRPSFTKGEVYQVALLQLATETDAYLFRMQTLTEFQILRDIFENKEIVKVGVAIRDDLKTLQKTFKFVPQNFIELQTLAKAKGLKNFGIKGMAEEVLQAPISKGPKLTNWEARVLSEQQLLYAATDAWIGLKLFQQLKN